VLLAIQIGVKHMAAVNGVKKLAVKQVPYCRQISVKHMAVDYDVLIVSVGQIHGLDQKNTTGTAPHVSNRSFHAMSVAK
jgi:molybdenum cofactor biosynthesis enzyme